MSVFDVLKKIFTAAPPEEIPENALLIDVRSSEEFSGGSLAEAINIPLNQIQLIANYPEAKNKSKPIVVFCASGMRSGIAKRQLRSMGYETVINGGGLAQIMMRMSRRN
jgi:rhodanese-related sulfurtransferase